MPLAPGSGGLRTSVLAKGPARASSPSLVLALTRSFAFPFLGSTFSKLLNDILTFINPQLLRWVTRELLQQYTATLQLTTVFSSSLMRFHFRDLWICLHAVTRTPCSRKTDKPIACSTGHGSCASMHEELDLLHAPTTHIHAWVSDPCGQRFTRGHLMVGFQWWEESEASVATLWLPSSGQ